MKNSTSTIIAALIIAAALVYHAGTGRYRVEMLPAGAVLIDTRSGNFGQCHSAGLYTIVCSDPSQISADDTSLK